LGEVGRRKGARREELLWLIFCFVNWYEEVRKLHTNEQAPMWCRSNGQGGGRSQTEAVS
jgi:hypothetical protein